MGKTMKRLSSIAMTIVLVAALSPGDRADARDPADGPAGKSASRGDAMIETYLARKAAALEKREFDGATSVEPRASHRDGPIFLNILRLMDVPEAFGLLAPNRLELVGPPGRFNPTEEIYRRAGAVESLTIR
jgi:hypothetical protein